MVRWVERAGLPIPLARLFTVVGVVVCPTTYNEPDQSTPRTPRSSVERTERIVGSPKLARPLGTNQLLIDLIGYARTDPAARLARWSEQHATAAYAIAGAPPGRARHLVRRRPAGRVLPQARQRHRSPRHRAAEAARLRTTRAFGPRYPVLLRVPGRRH